MPCRGVGWEAIVASTGRRAEGCVCSLWAMFATLFFFAHRKYDTRGPSQVIAPFSCWGCSDGRFIVTVSGCALAVRARVSQGSTPVGKLERRLTCFGGIMYKYCLYLERLPCFGRA